MEDKKIILSLKDLEVKFKVRGRTLNAIRKINLDVYEDESLVIVGESGSGKSVLTKTFAGMLDSNGYISNGEIIFHDKELEDTRVIKTKRSKKLIGWIYQRLNSYSRLEGGSEVYHQIIKLEEKYKKSFLPSDKDVEELLESKENLEEELISLYNQGVDLKRYKDKESISILRKEAKEIKKELKYIKLKLKSLNRNAKKSVSNEEKAQYKKEKHALLEKYKEACIKPLANEQQKRNLGIAKEIYLAVGRYNKKYAFKKILQLLSCFKNAMRLGMNIEENKKSIFSNAILYVELKEETDTEMIGTCELDLAKLTHSKDWSLIRGKKISTIFQDPMTSLNPILTIGKQITQVIMKHQNCNLQEAKKRAIEIMDKVGISNPKERFNDYPFQYSGGMRQRIVIAIALSCQPRILICDEPTTALDVTIQAQILKLIKDLQKEFHYTIVFITHDLGVVANIADRVAVIYAGQIVEIGTSEEIFYDPLHPYTWALLSSLPQLAEKGEELYSIHGTPPSLYSRIEGDPFAYRNPYCLNIDFIEEPPMFKVTATHYAKTWLLDPRAEKIEKPKSIEDIHNKLLKSLHVTEDYNA